jgi:thiol-disulfide isomerase/thioredoxin
MNKFFHSFVLIALAVSSSRLNAEPTRNAPIAPHAGDLVVLEGDKLVPFNSGVFLRTRYIVLYFGAGWCPDCRRFSPSLVAEYDHQPVDARRFEVLLLSRDKSAEGMLKFMKIEKMRWPALAFDKVSSAEDLNRFYSGHGIPCLTVIDPKGTVILQSKDDQDANEVLEQLLRLLKSSATK